MNLNEQLASEQRYISMTCAISSSNEDTGWSDTARDWFVSALEQLTYDGSKLISNWADFVTNVLTNLSKN